MILFWSCKLVLLQIFVVCYASPSIGEFLKSFANVYDKLSRGIPVADELPCHLSVSAVNIIRKSEKQGFHRNIVTDVDAVLETSCQACSLMLVEHLPEGLFVDPYQLKSLQDFGGPQVLSLEDIDVEKPEYLSPNHTIAVYSRHVQPSSTGQVTATIDLPAHLRYHMVSDDPNINHAVVYLQLPDLFIHCKGCPSGACFNNSLDLTQSAPCTAANHSLCLWTPLSYTMDSYDELEFHVPVGQEGHSIAVTAVTLAAIIIGAIILIVAMERKNDATQKMKQR